MTGKLSPTEHLCGIRSCAHHLYMHSDFTLSEWRLVFILNEGTQHVGEQVWNWSSTIWLQSQGVAQDSWVLEAQSHLWRRSWAPVLQRRVSDPDCGVYYTLFSAPRCFSRPHFPGSFAAHKATWRRASQWISKWEPHPGWGNMKDACPLYHFFPLCQLDCACGGQCDHKGSDKP